jgi:hypothetical protein
MAKSASSTPAARVAQQLAAKFLAQGNYGATTAIKGSAARRQFAAAALPETEIDEFYWDSGVSGLEVQAVGCEEGIKNPKVHIYVSRASRREINALPTAGGDVAIALNRMGRLAVRPDQASIANAAGNLYTRGNRVACGSSCAPGGESYAGTLGALVRKRNGKEQGLYLISNNHVLGACNQIPVDMPVLAPANSDARPMRRAPGEVARLAEVSELRTGEPTLVTPCREDIALARVIDPSVVTSWQGDDATGFDTPNKIVSPKSYLRVKKFGRTSGLTLGTVESRLSTPTPIPYKLRQFTATVWFVDVWTVFGDDGEDFASAGDSGSLVVTEEGDAAVGLIFAAKDGYGLIMPMDHIATCFGTIELVHGHGVQ